MTEIHREASYLVNMESLRYAKTSAKEGAIFYWGPHTIYSAGAL